MKGYKGFNEDLTCLSFQYKIGKTYKIQGKPLICERGFHFCEKLEDVFGYYAFFNPDNEKYNRFCEIEALGDIATNYCKSCTNKIKIVRELSKKDICEILNIDYNTFTKYKEDFNDERINQIFYGLIHDLDVFTYAKPEFSCEQMKIIRFGLVENLNISVYAKPEFDACQMEEIRCGLQDGLDVSVYAKPEFYYQQMEIIRLGLEDNLDVSIYAKPEFDAFQMEEIRRGLIYGLDVSIYAKPEFDCNQMKIIRCDLKGEKC